MCKASIEVSAAGGRAVPATGAPWEAADSETAPQPLRRALRCALREYRRRTARAFSVQYNNIIVIITNMSPHGAFCVQYSTQRSLRCLLYPNTAVPAAPLPSPFASAAAYRALYIGVTRCGGATVRPVVRCSRMCIARTGGRRPPLRVLEAPPLGTALGRHAIVHTFLRGHNYIGP